MESRSKRVTKLQDASRTPAQSLLGLLNESPHITIICGKKGSGKSTLFLRLLLCPRAYCGRYDRVLFISPTFRHQFATLWHRISPEGVTVFEDLSVQLLQRVMDEQGQDPSRNCLVVCDDL